MRKNFILFVLIPLFILVLVVYLFIDGWIESGLEYAGEKAVGAKVEIDGLRVTLSPIGIRFERLQVANSDDPWKNLFETGRVQFALNFGQLLRGKYIIETMEVNNFILGTKRTTDGSLPREVVPTPPLPGTASLTAAAAPALKKDEKKAPVFDIAAIRKTLNIDSLVNPNNLASYRQIDTLKRQIQEASAQWDKSTAEFDASKARLAQIESNVRSIDVNAIKDVQSATNALNTVKGAADGINDISKSFQQQKDALTRNVNQFSGSIGLIDDLARQDYQNVLRMARLPDVSMKGLAGLLLGPDILNKAYTYLGYVQMAKDKIPSTSSKPAEESPRRMRGQVIHFPADRAYPKFWIQKILLSGGTDQKQDPQYFYAKGQILNITNDQRVTRVPLTASILATRGGTTTLTLDASFDRRGDIPVDDYKAKLTGLAVDDMQVGNSGFLPSKITNATADASITVHTPGNQFDSNTRIDFRGMRIVFAAPPKNNVERIAHDVLASISGFFVNLRMWKDTDKFDVAFSTDLDDQLASRTKKVLGDELAKLQNELRARVDGAIAAKRREVMALYDQKRADVMAKVKSYETMMNEKVAMVEKKKKELEDKVNAEKKKQEDALKKKAGDALKGLFK